MGNVPHLRFPEFSGEWKKCKLGDLCNVLMCKRILVSQTNTEDGVPFYKIGTIGSTPDAYISKELFDDYKVKYNYPRKGEVMITCAGTVGKCVVYDGEDAYFQDSNIVWIDNPTQYISNGFLFHLLSKVDWRKLNSTTIIRIYNDDLRNLKMSYPRKEEQQKISHLLSLLDERIATQNKIIEDLKKLKCAIIDYTFDNKTQSHRKRILLSDVSAKITRRNTDNQNFNVLSNSANQGIIPQNEVFDREIANENNTSNYFVISQNDFVYNPRKSVTAPYGPINRYNGETNGVISPLYLCFRCYGIDVEYLGWYFKSDSWHKYVYQNGDTGVRHDRVSIKDEIFFSMPLYLHSTEEQMEIAKRLNKIESFVSQEEKYLFLLRSQKLYLLQQMFI